jgi:hypothetical protein
MKPKVLIALVLGAAVACLWPATAIAGSTSRWLEYAVGLNGKTVQPSAADMSTVRAASHTAKPPNTVPFWQASFTYQGANYPFQMVGTDPRASVQTTVVPPVVIPVDLTYNDARNGASANLSGTSVVSTVLSSPLFNSDTWAATGDVTQYGDAIQRAEFAGVLGSSSSYHLLLGQPTVMSTTHITVPASKGFVDDPIGDGVSRGQITDTKWWSDQLQNLIDTNHVTPNQLVIVLTKDTLVGLTLGFHGARLTGAQIQTYIWDSWVSPRLVVPLGLQPDFALDIQGLGHEIAEWQNDPFTDNVTPPWAYSIPPVLPNLCGNLLEVGDPLELAEFPEQLGGTTYHVQDIAFLPWFARQAPSFSFNGQYSFTGTLTTFSSPC